MDGIKYHFSHIHATYVSYGLAASIDVTAFLLSLNVAIKMRHVTLGLPWYQKTLAATGVIITHWPFILLLVGFSWLVNFEHAREFHSSMLEADEQVSINLIIWQGKLADLNPVIASSFPLLAVAYTGMADQMGEEHGSTSQDKPAHPPPATVHPAEEGTPSAHGQMLEREAMLQALQEGQEHLLQSVQMMMEQHQQAMQHLTQQSLAQFAETMQTILRETREQEKAVQVVSTAHAAERRRPGTAAVPSRGNQQDQLRPRDPAVVLHELMEQLPHLAGCEEDALQVIVLYQQGLDRSKIREALRFGTQKYSTIIKPIGDRIQAGQVVLFADEAPSTTYQPGEQTTSLLAHAECPDVPTDLPILLAVQSEGIRSKEQQTTTMPAVSNIACATETNAVMAIQQAKPA